MKAIIEDKVPAYVAAIQLIYSKTCTQASELLSQLNKDIVLAKRPEEAEKIQRKAKRMARTIAILPIRTEDLLNNDVDILRVAGAAQRKVVAEIRSAADKYLTDVYKRADTLSQELNLLQEQSGELAVNLRTQRYEPDKRTLASLLDENPQNDSLEDKYGETRDRQFQDRKYYDAANEILNTHPEKKQFADYLSGYLNIDNFTSNNYFIFAKLCGDIIDYVHGATYQVKPCGNREFALACERIIERQMTSEDKPQDILMKVYDKFKDQTKTPERVF